MYSGDEDYGDEVTSPREDGSDVLPATRREIYYRDDVEAGDEVETTADVRNFDEVLPAGSRGTVVRLGGSHHTQNGGGFDVEIRVAGRRWSTFLVVDGHYVTDAAGKYATKKDARGTISVNSKHLRKV